jgi:hypothetical protein
MNSPTLQDINALRDKMEAVIEATLSQFVEATGLDICSIDMEKIPVQGVSSKRPGYKYLVHVEVRL